MEVSALKYSSGIGLHGRTPLLRLQSDERLIAFLRKGNNAAFEVLMARYESRLMSFCRHLLGSREDAEDVLQEVMTAAFNAILADDRPINVRPWLYRIARNRSLNHLRRISAIGVDSMDHHLSEHGASTADKVHEREEFRLLVGDIHDLPETQKTALVLREMDALSYEQIAEAMETTVPSVKSLLVRARVSLAEAAEARLLSCDQVRIELAEITEGLVRRPSPLARRHLRSCKRCTEFRSQLKQTNKALAALLPVGPAAMLHKLLFLHLGHSAGAGAGSGATAATGATAAGSGAAGAGASAVGAGTTALAGSGALAGTSGFVSAGIGAFAGKAAAGLAAAALVTAGAVEANHPHHRVLHRTAVAEVPVHSSPEPVAAVAPAASYAEPRSSVATTHRARKMVKRAKVSASAKSPTTTTPADTATAPVTTTPVTTTAGAATKPVAAGRTQTQSDPTVLPTPPTPTATTPSPTVMAAPTSSDPTTTSTTPTSTTPTTTTTTTPSTTPTSTTPTTTTPTTTDPTTTPTTPTTTTPQSTTPEVTPPHGLKDMPTPTPATATATAAGTIVHASLVPRRIVRRLGAAFFGR
jgi:RNA polymerase sigma factor (sigma-70 family)